MRHAARALRNRRAGRGHRSCMIGSSTSPAPLRAASGRRFLRTYTLTVASAYALVLGGLCVFLATQWQQRYAAELRIIEDRVRQHALFLEFVLRSAADQVEALRMAMASAGRGDAVAGCRLGRDEADLNELRQTNGGFDRDHASDRDAGGNLVGLGTLALREPRTARVGQDGRASWRACDLRAALALDRQLRALPFTLPQIASARFVAADDFHLVAPWRPAAAIPFDPAVRQSPLWLAALPERNPDRRKYWSPARLDSEATGLLAPVAVPVYDGTRLRGVIALDLSIDYLNRINGGFGYPLGVVTLVDAGGAVLAHPDLYRDPLQVRATPALAAAFATPLPARPEAYAGLPQGVATPLADHIVVRHAFVAAPWQLLYAVPRMTLAKGLLRASAGGMLALLVALAVVMATTYALTVRQFVRPAAHLVEHVIAESQRELHSESHPEPRPEPRADTDAGTLRAARPLPVVPADWQPWFRAVSKAFAESLQWTRLRQELAIAADLQQSLLPRSWPSSVYYRLNGTMRPAREIGGDFYDHFVLPDGRRALVIADVSGKGITAGLFAMAAKSLVRTLAGTTGGDLPATLEQANEALAADNPSCMFVTLFCAAYDAVTGRLDYVSAGHPPPLHVRCDGISRWLDGPHGPALGMIGGVSFTHGYCDLAPGDLVLVYTDGVTEAMNAGQQQFGEQRLQALFRENVPVSPEAAIGRVLDAVNGFAAGCEQFDDITCMALSCAAHVPILEGVAVVATGNIAERASGAAGPAVVAGAGDA